MDDVDEPDEREELFYNNVREKIVRNNRLSVWANYYWSESVLIGLDFLFVFRSFSCCLYCCWRLAMPLSIDIGNVTISLFLFTTRTILRFINAGKHFERYCVQMSNKFLWFLILFFSLLLCTVALAVAVGAALLLPISIASNEVLSLYPSSYYVQWLNHSLIHGKKCFLCFILYIFFFNIVIMCFYTLIRSMEFGVFIFKSIPLCVLTIRVSIQWVWRISWPTKSNYYIRYENFKVYLIFIQIFYSRV